MADADGGESVSTPIYLNVYDVASMNSYLYWVGLGAFHSGIEVHGMEYGFGAHQYECSGVFEVEPKQCPGFIYKRTVWLGTTKMSHSQFLAFLEDLSSKFNGCTYNLIYKNCNHFTDEVCNQLTGKHIPGWVNRLARIGSFCGCMLPQNTQMETVAQLPVPCSDDDGVGTLEYPSTEDNYEEAACCQPLMKPHIDMVHPSDKSSKSSDC